MKKLIITLAVLIILTIVTAIISNTSTGFAVTAILILAMLKFIGVAFYFMEMRRAHSFWKVIILAFAILFLTTTLIII